MSLAYLLLQWSIFFTPIFEMLLFCSSLHTCTRTRILAPTPTTNIYIKNDSKNRPDSKIVFLTSSVQFCQKSFIFFQDNQIATISLKTNYGTQNFYDPNLCSPPQPPCFCSNSNKFL